MQTLNLTLHNHQYRYATYTNPTTNSWGIFLLGALQEIESVTFFCEHFSKDLNILVLETPGTGMTSSIDATTSIIEQAVLVKVFLNHMNLKQAHMLVFSYSTAIAVELYRMWHGFLSLSICGGIPGIPKTKRLETAALLGTAVHSRTEFAKGFINILTIDNPSIPKAKIISRAARKKVFSYNDEQLRCFIENTLRLLVYRPSFDLSLITVPSLLCIGEKDPYVNEQEALSFIDKLPFSSLVKIKNADHLTHIQQPYETAESMIFLAREALSDNMLTIATKEVA